MADDRGKLAEDGGAAFFASMRDIGLTENRITLAVEPRPPDHDPGPGGPRSLHGQRRGCRHSHHDCDRTQPRRALFNSGSATSQFVSFVAHVARTYRQVKDIAVGSRPNQPRSWQPQFSTRGAGLACTPRTARGYSVRPTTR